MPELPDIEAYLVALEPRLVGGRLEGLRLASAFFLRSVEPGPAELEGRVVLRLERLGKRIVIELEEERFVVVHLMIAGRLVWRDRGAALPGRRALAGFDFDRGTLIVTEAGTRRRASLHLIRGRAGLADHDRGGIDPLTCTPAEFRATLDRERHTLKRALTDPRLFSGIGNAYSDEILFHARLSPFLRTDQLDDEARARLFEATRATLARWRAELCAEAREAFPTRVTAFRPGMAVHGRHDQPCPDCGAPVQRIVYATREANYCARCQTGGRLLADRALSRLLKDDWPRTIDELERPG